MSTKPKDSNGEDGLAHGPEDDQPMAFWDHLAELRRRLFKSVLAIVVGVCVCWAFTNELINFMRQPLIVAWKRAGIAGAPQLQVLKIEDPLVVDIRVAMTAAIFFAGPVIFYQIWMFVSPGLYRHEKRFAIPFVMTSVAMFLAGAAFAYSFVVPYGYEWLLNYGGAAYSVQLELSNYIKGTTLLLLAFGSVFEFPLLIAFLAKMGVVSHRTLLHYWRVAIIIIFIVAGVLTPPEPISQLMMATPMVFLFFVSVGVAYILNPAGRVAPDKEKPEHAPAAGSVEDVDDVSG